jgi:hypothetical protein
MYPQWDSSVPHTSRWACCRLVADRWPTMPTSLRFVGCLRDDVFVSALVIHVSGLVCLTTDSAHGEVFVVAFTTHVGEVAIVGVDRNRRACPPRWAKSLWLSLRPSMNPSLMGGPLEVRVKAFAVFEGWMMIRCVVPLPKDESAMQKRWSHIENSLAALEPFVHGIGVHSGRPAQPGPSLKRPVLFEFRAVPGRPMGLALGPRPGP